MGNVPRGRAHPEEFGVRAMCRMLRIHVSGFYAWLREPMSTRAEEAARQTALIREARSDSGKVYGYRKLHDDLRDQGESTACIREFTTAGRGGGERSNAIGPRETANGGSSPGSWLGGRQRHPTIRRSPCPPGTSLRDVPGGQPDEG